MNKTIILMLICTLLTSTAQILYKFGVSAIPSVASCQKISLDATLFSCGINLFIVLITNWQLIIGLLIYFIAALVMIKALKGDEVSTAYPILATSYIWVMILSAIFIHEEITLLRVIGVLVIIAGVTIIGMAGKNNPEAVA